MKINNIVIGGNLVAKPELKATASGKAVAEMRLAVQSGWGENEKTAFIDVTAWGKTAEVAAQHLDKGQSAVVVGRICQDTWDDRDTGKKRSKIYVTAESVQFVWPPKDQPGPRREPQHVTMDQVKRGDLPRDDDDDIPF